MSTPIILAGAAGKMGRAALAAIADSPDTHIWGATTRQQGLGQDAGLLIGREAWGLFLQAELAPLLQNAPPETVLVDLSHGAAAYHNALLALKHQRPVVIGATGLSEAQIEDLQQQSEHQQIGVLLAPNFSLGALLMMRFAVQAAQYFDWVEIIERHHENKRDAPSGTARKTAELIAEANAHLTSAHTEPLARGEQVAGIPVHSLRLPGSLAHQEVLFGGLGQTLTLRHDSLDRASFMPGLLLAIQKVRQLQHCVYGLENLI
ncbi:MAG: 4-hydroxy-tetrahydrodipicolinate reductase [Candidatus Sericytochromatia bacterium]|nr:4-hydroxy-tetrahydrodipicolinate reductase [Candidatus Sericytochromatia bacterium]